MIYLIIPIRAGSLPKDWYTYLLGAGNVVVFVSLESARANFSFFKEAQIICVEFDEPPFIGSYTAVVDFSKYPFQSLVFALCDKVEDSINRYSTEVFKQVAWRLQGYNAEQKTLQIGLKQYGLLCSTRFIGSPVSISRIPNRREIIYYNESSKTLNRLYQQLKEDCQQFKIEKVIEILTRFVRDQLPSYEQDLVDNVVRTLFKHRIAFQGEFYEEIPAVNLKRFLEKGVGVCRHHAMFTCYLLQRLQQDNLLPEGKIIHYRTTMKNRNGHSFVLIQDVIANCVYIIDTILNLKLILPYQNSEIIKYYGNDIHADIASQYIQVRPCSPTLPIDDEMDFEWSLKSSQ